MRGGLVGSDEGDEWGRGERERETGREGGRDGWESLEHPKEFLSIMV